MSEKIVLIDGNSIVNRAFYGLPDLTTTDGRHTNGILGFFNILLKLLEEEKPQYLAVERTDSGIKRTSGCLRYFAFGASRI